MYCSLISTVQSIESQTCLALPRQSAISEIGDSRDFVDVINSQVQIYHLKR
jgi:hypothetical protein